MPSLSCEPPAVKDEKISAAPLEKASKVTPARVSDKFILSEILVKTGVRLLSAILPSW